MSDLEFMGFDGPVAVKAVAHGLLMFYICQECGATVHYERTSRHSNWHDDINSVTGGDPT